MSTFVRANHQVIDFVYKVMGQYRSQKNGYPAAAIISITPPKQRVLGVADASLKCGRPNVSIFAPDLPQLSTSRNGSKSG